MGSQGQGEHFLTNDSARTDICSPVCVVYFKCPDLKGRNIRYNKAEELKGSSERRTDSKRISFFATPFKRAVILKK